MMTAPTQTDVTTPQQDMLNAIAALGQRLLDVVIKQAEAGTLAAVEAGKTFDTVSRAARRALWLRHKLGEPAKTVDRVAARKQIIRTVEDNIQRHAEDADEDEDTLREELLDRLDTLDLEDEIADRPVDAIITDILRDLGLAHVPGNHPWKRRTPDDLAELTALANKLPGGERTPVLSRGPVGEPLAFQPQATRRR